MNPVSNRISWAYQKNKHLVDSLLFRKAPAFVYSFHPDAPDNEVPVFTFHTALPDWFEEQCRHLVENGYRTLTAEEFNHRIMSSKSRAEKTVFITFDDGLKQVWSVAYPILKKYGLHATCFLIPGCIPEEGSEIRDTLEDAWEGKAEISDVMGILRDESPLATWQEIKIMHQSGVIDFQSHTMNHAVVPVSDEIVDFIHPGYDPHFYGNIHIPLYTEGGQDVVSRRPLLGMPIYASRPRMQAAARYFDDEKLRKYCVDEVDKRGGREFFNGSHWRSTLRQLVDDYKKSNALEERYETPEERDLALLSELAESKRIIEEKLPGKAVNQLCYPWYDANDHAMQASRKAGYDVNFFGQREDRINNVPGQDPFKVVRIEEIFLQRLPGKGRKSVRQALLQMYKLRSLPSHMFPEGRPGIV